MVVSRFLANRAINEIIALQEWDQIVSELTAEIKKVNQAKAICRAVKETGKILQQHFPLQKDDQDELHNLIIK